MEDVVPRGKAPGQVERVVKGRRGGPDQADMLSHRGQGGQQHRRLQGLERLLRRLPGQRDPIGEEDGVEGPALCYPGDFLEELDLDEGRRVLEHTPAARVAAGARDVYIQMELAVVMRHRG